MNEFEKAYLKIINESADSNNFSRDALDALAKATYKLLCDEGFCDVDRELKTWDDFEDYNDEYIESEENEDDNWLAEHYGNPYSDLESLKESATFDENTKTITVSVEKLFDLDEYWLESFELEHELTEIDEIVDFLNNEMPETKRIKFVWTK